MKKRAKKPAKPIPAFHSDEEADEFWMTHDTTEYLDWSKARRVSFLLKVYLAERVAKERQPPRAHRRQRASA